MKKFLFLLTISALAAASSCSEKGPTITFSLIPGTEITAGGTDEVTFTVKFGEKDITSSAIIKLGDTEITGNTFSSEDVGKYTFTAEYDGNISNKATITVREAMSIAVSTETLEFPPQGGTLQVGVTSAVPWSITNNYDWIKIDVEGGSGDGTVNVTVDREAEEATGSILIHNEFAQKVITVTKDAPPYLLLNATFEDYLGNYTISGDLKNVWDRSAEPHIPSPYSESVRMVNYRGALSSMPYDFMALEFVLSELDVVLEDVGMKGFSMGFVYNADTCDISYYRVGYARVLFGIFGLENIFMYLNEDEDKFYHLGDDQVRARLNSAGELIIDTKWTDENGKEWDLYFASYLVNSDPATYLSYDALYNIKIVKN